MTRVLSVGSDHTLLGMRTLVLASAGYQVASALGPAEFVSKFFDGDFDAVVLCHSLTEDQRQRIAELVRRHSPSTPVVVLGRTMGSHYDYGDFTVSGDARDLLGALSRLPRDGQAAP